MPRPPFPLLSPYLGPLRTYLSGNIEGAQQRVGLARLLIGQLSHRLTLGGITSGRGTASFPDGTIIRAEVSGELYQAQIYVPILEEEEGATAFPYLSGLHEIARVYAFNEENLAYATQYFPSFSPNKNPRSWYTLNVGFEDNIPFPLTPPLVAGSSPPDVSFAWRWINRTLPPLDFDFRELRSYSQWPTMYTGRMRMVVQKLLGRRLRNPFHTNCGIYLSDSTKPGVDQQRWVIEINQDQGIFAWPVRFFDEMALLTGKQRQQVRNEGDTDRYDYGFEATPKIPIEIDTDANRVLLSNGKSKLRLASKDVIAKVYEKQRTPMTPWYPNWAFSYDGHEAQIVLFEIRQIGGLDISYSTRFKLSISSVNGSPSSASIDVIDEGYVALGQNDTQLWAPYRYAVQEPVFWVTSATVPAFDSPLYVFYDRNNQEVVLRQKCKPNGPDSDTHVLVGFDCTTTQNCLPAGSFCPTDTYFVAAELCNVGDILDITGKSSWTSCLYCDRTFPPAYVSSYSIYSKNRWMGDVIGRSGFVVQCNLGFLDYVYAEGYRIEVFETEVTSHAETTSYSNRVTLPLYEREGFFHYQNTDIVAIAPFNVWNNHSSPAASAVHWDTQTYRGNTTPLTPAYTMGGAPDITSVVNYPAGTTTSSPGYKFIGSIVSTDDSEDSAITNLQIPTDISDFSNNVIAIAAIEAFTGKFIIMPEPRDSWKFDVEYPVHSSYRWIKEERPSNFCFVGDGTGDKTWNGDPDEFVDMPPEFSKKNYVPETPIDLYAIGLPK